MKKVALFVDVQNIYYTTRQAFSQHFDYRRFWEFATDQRHVVAAYAYAIERQDLKQQQFQQILREIGFEIKLKPYIQRKDGSTKGDWDVGITLDMIEYAPQADVIILLSGDGDFDLALNRLEAKYGVTTEVFGVRSLTANSLISAAGKFFPIEKQFLLPR